MAAEVDVRAVATFSSLSESSISTILEQPTVELVRALLLNLSQKAHDHQQLLSQKTRLEVELEAAVRSSESRIKVLKGSVEKGLAETSSLRKELQCSGEG
jgi:nucleoprotein TPR